MSERKFERIEGGWKNVPDHMKTKTQLNQMGFKPSRDPIGEVWSHKVWIQLYDVKEVVAKRKVSEKQLAALEQARKKAEENRTCQRCGMVVSKKKYIHYFNKERVCERCFEIRQEEHERKLFFLSNYHETKVAGVTYEGRQQYIEQMSETTKLKLEREPDNRHHDKAVKVHAEINGEWHQIGYLHWDYAEWASLHMDKGETVQIKNEGIEKEEYQNWDYYNEEYEVFSFLRIFIKIFI